ncbi:isochorismatase family protein [Methylomonas rivi]|uniref:Isochorismatase family protein n=1 Tax=Methylomonas rivi TaxID=2952226 RepID=A0ABT1U7X0_9GAMM|nr:isochorismatase family protein [Methylomonas sp. WSC-6]MCQ8129952.1 isochorismatase family protein [Methylomonas sp. WSC-6]
MADAADNRSGLLSAEHSLLLIVDMQGRLLEAMPPADAQTMLDNSVRLLKAAALLEVPVLLTEQYPKGLGHTADAVRQALPTAAACFEKTAFSCCGSDAVTQALRGSAKSQIVIAGQEAHVCVLQTAFDLLRQGFEVFVVEDAVCSRAVRHKENALWRMRQAGAGIVCHESVLFEWLRDASHPQFKSISALLR